MDFQSAVVVAALVWVGFITGALVTGTGFRAALRQANANLELKDKTEAAILESVSPAIAHRVFDLAQILVQGGQFVEGVLDLPVSMDGIEGKVKDVAGAIAEAAQFTADVTDGEPNVVAPFEGKGVQKPAA